MAPAEYGESFWYDPPYPTAEFFFVGIAITGGRKKLGMVCAYNN